MNNKEGNECWRGRQAADSRGDSEQQELMSSEGDDAGGEDYEARRQRAATEKTHVEGRQSNATMSSKGKDACRGADEAEATTSTERDNTGVGDDKRPQQEMKELGQDFLREIGG